jgi:hypothetical protein
MSKPKDMIVAMSPAWWHLVVGYALSVLVGGILITLVMINLQTYVPNYNARLPRHIGWLERVLYTASWQAGRPEFIGVWLALKTVQRLSPRVRHDVSLDAFNVYLIASGLSVGFGVLGGLTIQWLANGHDRRVLFASLAAIVGTLLYALLAPRNDGPSSG